MFILFLYREKDVWMNCINPIFRYHRHRHKVWSGKTDQKTKFNLIFFDRTYFKNYLVYNIDFLDIFKENVGLIKESDRNLANILYVFSIMLFRCRLCVCVAYMGGCNWVQLQPASLPDDMTPWVNRNFPRCQSCLQMKKPIWVFCFFIAWKIFDIHRL